MNIQIFGTKKCNDTKKAERFFKERGIKYQFIDMKEEIENKSVTLIINSSKLTARTLATAFMKFLRYSKGKLKEHHDVKPQGKQTVKENMINWEGKDKDLLALIKYIADEDKLEKVLENPQVIKTPVVRNGKQSTLGYQPDIWKGWK